MQKIFVCYCYRTIQSKDDKVLSLPCQDLVGEEVEVAMEDLGEVVPEEEGEVLVEAAVGVREEVDIPVAKASAMSFNEPVRVGLAIVAAFNTLEGLRIVAIRFRR